MGNRQSNHPCVYSAHAARGIRRHDARIRTFERMHTSLKEEITQQIQEAVQAKFTAFLKPDLPERIGALEAELAFRMRASEEAQQSFSHSHQAYQLLRSRDPPQATQYRKL